ncbi:uncharacterized protein Z519_11412 [Cladophialophora bantiana CBS 173.52]|uniref:EthD domain-containing protein n=1 Tax=Cladophialophora bantiana (strain ATCC 10958 / CBS 173.52 / CDC B-1940 / NIH 8579) TaxID=1442370 RepID=A0A0D2H3D2_CLAB1|nr:uncharacterized protein Z519_11412 [Cladophialophora bantiana CBS 173.52]KIW87828.1 hypothetical protein Z519_11412 [Cladophialophora bantiana CBS 173.52]
MPDDHPRLPRLRGYFQPTDVSMYKWSGQRADLQFDLDGFNAITKERFGYPLYQYWYFFTSPDGYQIIDNNLERFWEVLHGAEPDWMEKMFAGEDAMTTYMSGNRRVNFEVLCKGAEIEG